MEEEKTQGQKDFNVIVLGYKEEEGERHDNILVLKLSDNRNKKE